MDLITLKNFGTAKETISKMKIQHSEWEKIIANVATDKRFISKTYKQLIYLNIRGEKKNLIKKQGEDISPKKT